MTSTTPHRGSTLLLAILVTASVLAVAIGLSVLVVAEIRAAGRITQSFVAYYAAESGIEEGLWRINDKRLSGATFDSTISAINANGWISENPPESVMDVSGATWDREADGFDQALAIQLIPEDTSTFVQISSENPAPPPRYIGVQWNDPGLSTQLLVTWVGWNPSTGFSDQAAKTIVDASVSVTDIPLLIDSAFYDFYQIQLRALGGDINALRIEAYSADPATCGVDGNGDPLCRIDIPSAIRITSVGRYPAGISLEASQQALLAQVLWKLPISGLYSFVLFSECRIAKGAPQAGDCLGG